MTVTQKINRGAWALLAAMLLAVLLLAACGPSEPAEPTPDVQAIFTAAAETIQADLTRVALLTPSPTATLEPTPTFTPTPTTDPLTITPLFTLAPLPVATNPAPAAPVTHEILSAKLVGETVRSDGLTLELAARNVDIVLEIKNIGTTTWTPEYSLHYFVWDKLGSPSIKKFGSEVKPGQAIRLTLDFNMPDKGGEYRTWWKLKRDDGSNFGDVYLDVKVLKPGPTNTPVPTP
ncbi:MAG: NBR1-Ig-like domain-containing protein [Anaerolineaceae bacterium]|nr:NBR1-Ig-like domain-containing protein [Anaerolineaceae bacterium]